MAYVGNTYTVQSFVAAIDYFSGNGSTTAFTLSRPVASVAQVQVTIENVPQNPSTAFTVSSNTITFTSAPPSGTNNIYVQYTSPITQVVALPQSPQVFGNLQMSSPGGNITGDYTNATITSRNSFQTSTANGSTGIYALPNGTSTAASWQATNAADPTNASKILIATNGSTDVQLVSGRNGTGTYLPLSFYTNGTQQMQLSTAGVLTGTAGNLMLISGTSQASTSGTSIDFTGIPSWVKRITVMFNGVSTNYTGSANIVLQLGTSGGIQTTSYAGSAGYFVNAGASAVANYTNGLNVYTTTASCTFSGVITFALLDPSSGLWVGSYSLGRGDGVAVHSGGATKTLSGTLDRIRITTSNGTDAFDAGSINILYE